MMFPWFRLATPALAGLLVLAQASPVAAQAVKTMPDKPVERPKFKELVVTPAPEPIPAFRYSLLPSSAKLNLGDAAPIYLRLRYGVPDAEWDEAVEKASVWQDVPLSELPLPEVKAVLANLESRFDLLAIAARREKCDWSYPLNEQRPRVIEIVMPDTNALRGWGSLLTLKARVEIAEGRFEDAAQTLETGLAFGRHVGTGPFIINAIIGISIESMMLNCLEDWIAKPGSPNLYWALTALPRPLVSLRNTNDLERLLPEYMVPELADLDAPRSSAAWSVHLESMYNRMRSLARRVLPDDPNVPKGEKPADKLLASLGADLAAYKQANLAAFRKHLAETGTFSNAQVEAMSDDEATARGVGLTYQTVWDEVFKTAYVPYGEVAKLEEVRNRMAIEAEHGPLAVFAELHSNLLNVQAVEARLVRRVAMLRTVEAIRMFAASHDGRLPESFDAIHEATIPIDPVTGEAFSLKLDCDVATLSAPIVPRMLSLNDYKITIRKDEQKASPPR